MPQLMPLNWIFSSMMMFMIIISSSIMYSEEIKMVELQDSMSFINEKISSLCW